MLLGNLRAQPGEGRKALDGGMRELIAWMQKPTQYRGTEWGSLVKDPATVRVRAALAFPDLYEVGMKLGYFRFNGYDPDGEANSLAAVKLVDHKALQAVIDTTFRPGCLNAAVLAPKDDEATVTVKGLADAAATVWPTPAPAPSVAETPQGEVAAPEVVDLGGGHTLVFLPDKTLPYVSVSLALSGGDALLAKDRQGLAELTANCLTTGTAKLTATALEDFLADRAANLSASSGRDGFTVSAKFPSRFQKDLYGLVADMAFTPTATRCARPISAFSRSSAGPAGSSSRSSTWWGSGGNTWRPRRRVGT